MVVGIDEVGRGAWAGPLVAGAVVLNGDIDGLKDSKQLNRSQRQVFAKTIHKQASAVGLGWVSAEEVDMLGLTGAVSLAMQRALQAVSVPYKQVIIDGNYNFLSNEPNVQCIVKADDSVACVSAASIVAKVARDEYMLAQSELYPMYGFDKHVGYGTRQHQAALVENGPSKLHRTSYKPVMACL